MKIIIALSILSLVTSTFCQRHSDKNEEVRSLNDSITIFADPPVASFPGGPNSLKAFIEKNLVYPKGFSNEGRVIVRFIVNTDSSLSDFEILKRLCTECDRNAIEVLKKTPKWNPASINGLPVKQRCAVPIFFKL